MTADVTLATMPAAEITALVHCFQKERGATCGWVGSHYGEAHSHFDALVKQMRKLVDAQRVPGLYRTRIDKIRAEADEAVSSAKAEAEAPPSALRQQQSNYIASTSFYSIFVQFNELIGPLCEATYNSELTNDSLLRDPVHEAFACLKEATGVERAFLCGVLALPEESLVHLPARATADLVRRMQPTRAQARAHTLSLAPAPTLALALSPTPAPLLTPKRHHLQVLGMQQQRTHEARVRETAPPKLLELIRAAFEYSAELGEVQTALQDTFDIAQLRGKCAAG